MKKERKAQVVTLVVLVAALGVALAAKTGWRLADLRSLPRLFQPGSQSSPEPQDTIYAMFAAARAGDVKAYLASYTGQMEASLRQELSETTESAFAQYLKDSNAAIKGVVVSEPQKMIDSEATVRVEYVYQDRNEAQTMYLERVLKGWKITRVDGDERVKTLIPYGTPVK